VLQIGGDVFKWRARLCLDRGAGEVDQPLQSRETPVEVVVAERVRVEPHQAHGQDGRDIIEETRQRR